VCDGDVLVFYQPLFDCDAPGGFLIALVPLFHGGDDDSLFFDQGIINLLSEPAVMPGSILISKKCLA
jgi:hypothetical protein